MVRDALAAVGIPAVINGAGSVFATDAAGDWLRLLEALERPASSTRVLAAALTPFVGWTAWDIDAADGSALENLHAVVHHWAGLLRRSGVATLLERITRTTRVPARVLATDGGERRLTDLRHVGQLLHAEASAEHLGTGALTAWLRQRVREVGEEGGAEERSRRLDTDAEAVQVLTIHRSKGLEFPVVYYPYLWDPAWIPTDSRPVIYHERDGDRRRVIDTAGGGATFVQHRDWQADEARGEDLRLVYVALTRARHQAIVWWAGSYDSSDSALGRLLFARDDDGGVAAKGRGTPTDAQLVARFEQLASQAPGRIGIERVGPSHSAGVAEPRPAPSPLSAAVFDRSIDRSWGRTSYTGLTADAHEPLVGSEPERPGAADDAILPDGTATPAGPAMPAGPATHAGPATTTATATPAGTATAPTIGGVDEPALRSEVVLLAGMPGGARVGSFVHAVLESVDFAADDLSAALSDAIGAEQARGPIPLGDPDLAVNGLRAAIETPLGPLARDVRLRDLHPADRLDELTFELPVAGGDRPDGRVTLAAIGDLLVAQLPPEDPLRDYPARLREPAAARSFRGYLTGSLDLVARLPGAGGVPEFAVIDYKTNLLGDDTPLSAWHYRPDALAVAMQRAHYPLQALLYSVALHRYLRWRLADYRPERHLGGVYYLFLRGMTGEAVPRVDGQPCGVFAWRPPTRLILALSDLLDEGLPDPDSAR
jgi:exodeoxyribonuclease V beta subunit